MSEQDIPQRIKPIEERILELVSSMTQWDYKIIRGYFPNEHEKSLYRALRKLEQEGKIRYLGWQGRTKQYTTKGVSNLPSITSNKGSKVDIKTMFPIIQSEYTEDYVWTRLTKLNDFPILIGQIFTTAQLDDESGFKDAYLDLMTRLNQYRSELRQMLIQAESITSHPIMAGDLDLFRRVVRSEMPDQMQLNEFKSWVTKLIKQREETNVKTLDF